MTDLDESLDVDQRAAVEAADSAISVSAGPGSGKTRTLSHRARHLLSPGGNTRALLLTFTNKAAAEMKARALAGGAIASDRLDAGTFHGFGARFLRSHGLLVGINADFEILDMGEAEDLAEQVAADLGVPSDPWGWSSRRIRQQAIPQSLAEFGRQYEAAKRELGAVDFDDLVVYPAQILGANEAVARAYALRYQHILVDEFQDTNAAHFGIVRALEPFVETISVFADDDQAIMRFAGADAANVRRFAEDIGAVPYPLTRNYRSRAAIVERANLLIAADPSPSGRRMLAQRDGGRVELKPFADIDQEAQTIGSEIKELVDAGAGAASIAILSRRAARTNALVAELLRLEVPVTDWRGEAYADDDKRLFVACLSCLQPRLSDRQASRLSQLFEGEHHEERDTHAFLQLHAPNPAAELLLAMREALVAGATPAELAGHASNAVASQAPESAPGVAELVNAVEVFQEHDPDFSVDQLLTELALKSGGRAPTQGGGVKVATLHGTKGLEWPTVYLVGLEKGMLPDYRATSSELLGDERRACFVGVSRAEESLTMTRVRRDRSFGQQPSCFLAEMGY